MVIRRIAPLKAAKVFATIYVVIGLIVGAIFTLVGSMNPFAREGLGVFAPVVGIGALIALPILYGFFGFIGTLIVASLYNVASGIVGGIELDVDQSTNVV